MVLRLFGSLVLALNVHLLIAQTTTSDYYIRDKDTIYCASISLERKMDNSISMTSLSMDGSSNTIHNIAKSNIAGFQINKSFYKLFTVKYLGVDWLEYFEQIYQGKIEYFTAGNYPIFSLGSVENYLSPFGGKYVRLDGGDYVLIDNNEKVETIIKPFVTSCQKFSEKYTDKYKYDKLALIIRMYNMLCK